MINRKGYPKNLKATKFENINYYVNSLRKTFQFSCLILFSFALVWSTEPEIIDKKNVPEQMPFNNSDSYLKFEHSFPLILRGTLKRNEDRIIQCLYNSTKTKAVILAIDEMYYEDQKVIYTNKANFKEWGPYGPLKHKILYTRQGSYGSGIDLLTIDIIMSKSLEAVSVNPLMKLDKTKTILLYEKPITPKSGIIRLFSLENEKIIDVFNYNDESILNMISEKEHSFNVITDKTEYRIREGKVVEKIGKNPLERIFELPWWTKIHKSPDGAKIFEIYFKETEIPLAKVIEFYEPSFHTLSQLKYKREVFNPDTIEIEVMIKGPNFNKRIPYEEATFGFGQGEGVHHLNPDFELKWSDDSKVILRYIYNNRIDRILEIPKIDTFWAENKKK